MIATGRRDRRVGNSAERLGVNRTNTTLSARVYQIFILATVLYVFPLFSLRQSMKNEPPICDKKVKMKWNSPHLDEWQIHSYLLQPVCSLYPEIYAN